jgi:DNA-binding PadR family transcriptional regulator
MNRPSDLAQGTLEALILSVVSLEALHGFAISQRLRIASAETPRR